MKSLPENRRSVSKEDVKMAILKQLAQDGQEQHKLNLLGNYPGARGPLEHRLGVTFDAAQRALAARAFDELKQDGFTQAPYSPGQSDPENWVEITDEGHRVLQTGDLEVRVADSIVISASKFGVPDHPAFVDRTRDIKGKDEVVSLIFLDLDNFKSVNDSYNHSVGDQVIRETIATIQEAISGKGELFHRGGDEILILLRNFDENEAHGLAERLRRAVERREFSTIGTGVVTAKVWLHIQLLAQTGRTWRPPPTKSCWKQKTAAKRTPLLVSPLPQKSWIRSPAIGAFFRL